VACCLDRWWWAIDDVEVVGADFVCDSSDEISAHRFESGDLSGWSTTAP
jgi:hypothetical protein